MIHTTIFLLVYLLYWNWIVCFVSFLFAESPFALFLFLFVCLFGVMYRDCSPSSVLVLFYTCIRIAVDIGKKKYENSTMRDTYTILAHKFSSTESFICCCCCFLLSPRLSVPFDFSAFLAVFWLLLLIQRLPYYYFGAHTKKPEKNKLKPRAITYGCLARTRCVYAMTRRMFRSDVHAHWFFWAWERFFSVYLCAFFPDSN